MCENQARPPTSQNGDTMPAAASPMTTSGGDGVVHQVEERNATGRHLPRAMRLADAEQDREMRDDPEQQQWHQSEAMLASLRIGVDGDGEAGDEPQVPATKSPTSGG